MSTEFHILLERKTDDMHPYPLNHLFETSFPLAAQYLLCHENIFASYSCNGPIQLMGGYFDISQHTLDTPHVSLLKKLHQNADNVSKQGTER